MVVPPKIKRTIARTDHTYSGPVIPIAYDPGWQLFTNLTQDQIFWFQAQPEWKNFLSWVALSPRTATINADVSEITINAALSATIGPPV